MKELITLLEDLGTGKLVPNRNIGICLIIEDTLGVSSRLLISPLVSKWPEYSGDRRYPVKGTWFRSPEDTFCSLTHKWSGRYGRRRKRLALFLAKELKKWSTD